ncbi:MAG TPA: peptidoglycan DD-metalloendopeptidase family protein [Stellaceae bacterium]|nr:peptidoglycan DD-metalloendopeptidase family protein [Stellaceae bacterium]
MAQLCVALVKRLFPERQFLLRSGESVRYLLLPGWLQAGALALFVAVVGGIAGLAGAYHHLHKAIHEKELAAEAAVARAAVLADLRQSVADADTQYGQMSDQFNEMKAQLDGANADNETLRTSIAGAEARVAVLDKTRLQLEKRLKGAEQALAGKSGNLAQLQKELGQSRAELHQAELARTQLTSKLQQLQADSATSSTRTSQLRDSLAAREQALRQMASERERLRTQLSQQDPARPAAGGYASSLEQLIASTGIDIERYIGRISTGPAPGEGGPYIAFDPRRQAQADKERQQQLQALAKELPLAAPLAHYQLESPFGPRIDPINHREGFHPGLDLGAPYRSPVLATAPGTVTFTGVKDEYGRVVEITHAHGIVTRYAHLHRILVAPGQKVALHQEVAELGSTGRSTGPHVHYEVLVDGNPVDPAKFLEAGKGVVQISATH